jgi:hypothetical protein
MIDLYIGDWKMSGTDTSERRKGDGEPYLGQCGKPIGVQYTSVVMTGTRYPWS